MVCFERDVLYEDVAIEDFFHCNTTSGQREELEAKLIGGALSSFPNTSIVLKSCPGFEAECVIVRMIPFKTYSTMSQQCNLHAPNKIK